MGLAEITGNPRWDAVGRLASGLLLGVIAIVLAKEMKSLLLGETASPEQLRDIETAVTGSPQVQRLIHMRTEHVGPDEILIGAKLEFNSHLTLAEVVEAVNRTEAAVRAAVPAARYVYIEPDITSTF